MSMKTNPFVPSAFPLGLFTLGIILLVFPPLRIAGMLAMILAVLYCLLHAALVLFRR